ncbi:hypothetical protein [Phocaeicola sp.]
MNQIIHRRGGVCPPNNTPNGVLVYAFGRANPAPTVDEFKKHSVMN